MQQMPPGVPAYGMQQAPAYGMQPPPMQPNMQQQPPVMAPGPQAYGGYNV